MNTANTLPQNRTILLNGKKQDIIPQKCGPNTCYPAEDAARTMGGTTVVKGNEVTKQKKIGNTSLIFSQCELNYRGCYTQKYEITSN